ncbi:hypothetical protein [Pseudomonas oryzicola]|uniref:Uncharacterized protein n=1 Tax=Pseudomonas oryzicola TaxID=485876 RepID=A0ABS6QEK9_9PSED|nr:hypothetical protein [Pseudomonas oryzicola]MBV4492650.1 hypothetical protein [Pseudomonas oryzicola]
MKTVRKFKTHNLPRPIKKPVYRDAEGSILNLGKIEGDVVAIFHFPGHQGVEGIKRCILMISSHSAGTFGGTDYLGDAADLPEALIELKIPKAIFSDEAYLEYRLVYEFLDNTELDYRDRSDSYTVVRK